MLKWMLNRLRGCAHKRTTFPITMNRARSSAPLVPGEAYVCCLDCGQEFPYDWATMRRGEPFRREPQRASAAYPLPRRVISTDVRQHSYSNSHR